MISNATSAAAMGYRHNMNLFNEAARQISDPDQAAGIEEVVQLQQAEAGMKVNAVVIGAANQISSHLIDILA